MLRPLAVLLGVALSAASLPAQLSQTLPIGFDSVRGQGASSSPLGPSPTTDQKWQLHYAVSNFPQLGAIRITEISFRAFNPAANLNAFNFNNFTVTLASATTGYQVGQHDPIFANNLGSDAAVVRTGPWAGGPVLGGSGTVAPWVPIGITSPFVFNPTLGQDLIVQIERCGGGALWSQSADHALGTTGTVRGNRYGNSVSCSATMQNQQGNEQVIILRIDYTPVSGFEYETNDAFSSTLIDGQVANLFTPAISNRCTGGPTEAQFASSGIGLPYDIGFCLAPPLRASLSGLRTPQGQIVNLNFAAPGGVFFLNGGALPNFATTAFPGAFTIPFGLPPVPGDLTVQMVNFAPGSPEGFALSQGAGVNFIGAALTAPGPVTDDSTVTFRFGAPPICGPNTFPFYGTRYTQFHLSSNGRFTFNTADSTFGPAAATNVMTSVPWVGAWGDLDPAVGGTITMSNFFGTLQADWNAVPWFGSGGSNTFSLQMDPSSGQITIQNLAGVTTGSQSQSAVGISPGAIGGATDPGAVNYGLNSGVTTNPTDAIYAWGASGTLTPGLSTLIFVPNAVNNYDWISF